MKKLIYILFLPIWILILSSTDVYAKEIENTCNYEVNNGGETVKVLCNFYDNNSHGCWFNNGGTTNNSEKISNWGSGADFNAKKYYSDNKKCLPYVVFVDTGAGINRYQLYAADSNATAVKIQADRNTFHKDSATIIGNSGATIKPDDNVLSYTEMLSDIGSNFELSSNCGVKNGKYVVDFNKTGYKLCRDKLQVVNSKINEWDKYIQEQINKGLLDQNSQVVKDYYAARDKANGKFSEGTQVGKEPTDDGGSIGSSDKDGSAGGGVCENGCIGISDSKAYKSCMSNCISSGKYDLTGKCLKCMDTYIPYNLPQFSRNMIGIVQIAVPIIIIITGMIELIKAIIASDEKKMDEVRPSLVRKFIVGISIYIVFAIVKFGFGLLEKNDVNEALSCASFFISAEGYGAITDCPSRTGYENGVSTDDSSEGGKATGTDGNSSSSSNDSCSKYTTSGECSSHAYDGCRYENGSCIHVSSSSSNSSGVCKNNCKGIADSRAYNSCINNCLNK